MAYSLERAHKLINKYTLKWMKYLGLMYWDVRLGFKDKVHCESHDDTKVCIDCDHAAVTEVQWEYQYAVITFYDNVLLHDETSDEQLEENVIHELQHLILDETEDQGEDWLKHEEHVATVLTAAFLRVQNKLTNGKLERPK